MNTVALFVSARIALACICVFDGNTPLAKRVMMDFGSVRSYRSHGPWSAFASIHG